MAYTKLGWVNDRAPALNQTNLNHMDQGIYDAHRRLSEYEDIFTGDVDESVQNWLDEHPEASTTVQDGAITEPKLNDVLARRIVRRYTTKTEMLSDTSLKSGMLVATLGYESTGDGGGAFYRIDSDGVADNIFRYSMENGLIATLLPIRNRYNALSLGFNNIGESDNATLLQNCVSNGNITIEFPAGIYRFSECDINTSNVALVGASKTYYPISGSGGSTFMSSIIASQQNAVFFAPMQNQGYILKYNNTRNCTLEGIAFTSVGIRNSYNNTYVDLDIINCALYLSCMSMSRIFNCTFLGIRGSAIICDNSWENDITNADFRFISPDGLPNEHGVIEFVSTNVYINSSAINISNCNIERVFCHAIYGNNARVQNCNISNMLVEINTINNWDFVNNRYDSGTPASNISNALGLFASKGCSMFSFSVANIICDNYNYFGFTKDGIDYFQSAITMALDDSAMSINIGTISFDTLSTNAYWFIGSGETFGKIKKLTVGTFANNTGVNNGLNGIQGTLTDIHVPDNSLLYDRTFANLYRPHTYMLKNMLVPPNVVSYGGQSVTFRRYAPSETKPTHIALITDDWGGVGITPTDTQKIICSIQAAVLDDHFLIVADKDSDLTVQQINSGTVIGTATKTESSPLDFYRLNVDRTQLYSCVVVRGNAKTKIYYMG